MGETTTVLLLAVLLDLVLSEPPNTVHPVSWMGRYLAVVSRRGRGRRPGAALAIGALGLAAGFAGCVAATWGLVAFLREAPPTLRVVLHAVLLKSTFSLRRLLSAAEEVRSALVAPDLPEARRLVGVHLVSRSTQELTAEEVAGATVESLAENFTDAVVAPLLFWTVAGLPAAVGYRFLNTADAMLGYRDTAHEYLGKAAARADDLANLIPARVAALLLLLAGGVVGGDVRSGLRILVRDRGMTASPNAGWTMSAMAGILGVRLTKRGAYALGDPETELDARAILRAKLVTAIGMVLAVVGAFATQAVLGSST
ncbi:MAG: cobalamin biosynthesis protein CobD [candidate division NC10 bacterium]|nr:cobalamin biosynthesis protein CobD [candidate division NC10 bacterium]